MTDRLRKIVEEATQHGLPQLIVGTDDVRALLDVVDLAKEMRRYCLGTDASTRYLIERFDAALAAFDALERERSR